MLLLAVRANRVRITYHGSRQFHVRHGRTFAVLPRVRFHFYRARARDETFPEAKRRISAAHS